MTQDEAKRFAQEWIEAWNSHDVDDILAHYDDDVVIVSPLIASMAGEPTGTLKGKEAVELFWTQAFMMLPNLRFELIDVFPGMASLIICYHAPFGRRSAELLELNNKGKIARAAVHYTEG